LSFREKVKKREPFQNYGNGGNVCLRQVPQAEKAVLMAVLMMDNLTGIPNSKMVKCD
jgi:hypothetical protein